MTNLIIPTNGHVGMGGLLSSTLLFTSSTLLIYLILISLLLLFDTYLRVVFPYH